MFQILVAIGILIVVSGMRKGESRNTRGDREIIIPLDPGKHSNSEPQQQVHNHDDPDIDF